MSAPRWLSTSWQGCRFCGRNALRLLRWSLWLLLGIMALVQITVLLSGELRVPRFVLREIETRLADSGLAAEFGEVKFSPSGHLLLQQVELKLAAVEATIMEADTVYLEVDPLALWWRELDVSCVRVDGVDLLLPAAFSPSGQAEPVLRGLSTTLRPGERRNELEIEHATTHLGPLAIAAHGTVRLPTVTASEPGTADAGWLQRSSRYYIDFCRQTRRLLTRLPEMERPVVNVVLSPSRTGNHLDLDLQADAVQLPIKAETALNLQGLRVQTKVQLGDAPAVSPLQVQAQWLHSPQGAQVENIVAEFDWSPAARGFDLWPGSMVWQTGRVDIGPVVLPHMSGESHVAALPLMQTRLYTRLAEEPLRANADLDLQTQAGRVTLAGTLGEGVLPLASEAIGIDVPALLSWEQAPYLEVAVNLGAGGQPLHATAAWQTEAVVARRVALDATAAQVRWQDGLLDIPHIRLRRGESVARGSYRMDIDRLAFTFLLEGRLRPEHITGWFKDWWPRFWQDFDFRGNPPDASVEVSGVWGQPLETFVFVRADGRDASIRDIALERMRTRLVVRPGWADIMHFIAEREEGTVEGRFARQWKLPDGRRWTRVEIDAQGRTDLSPVPKLLKQTGEELIAPFAIEQPLELSLRGSVTREDIGAPITEDFYITGRGEGPWTFFGFPLENLSFSAHRATELMQVERLATRVAGGPLTGRMELSGATGKRQVVFDLNLEDAALQKVVEQYAVWNAERKDTAVPDGAALAAKIGDAQLSLSLTAEGPADDALAWQGTGSAAVTGADLAEINMLGVLSAMLKRTVLNFSTLELNHAYANFTVEGPQVVFPELFITGDRGAVEATGTYALGEGALDFKTKVRPFEGGEGLLDAVFSPLTAVLEVNLSGELSDPTWTFVYGPTNLLRNLTGENRRPASSSATPSDGKSPVELPPNTPAPQP